MGKGNKRPQKKRRAATRQTAPTQQRAGEQAVRAQTWRVWGFVAVLFVLAIALRVSLLTAQSLWADEGNSVRLTERSLGLVIDAARADIHPPGYYLLLWGWARLFGQSEFSVRALSVAIGVALVGLIYILGERVRPRRAVRAGWLAAFCAAVSPFQVQYSQEVRMYILVAFLGAGATYAFVRWIQEVQSRTDRPLLWSGVYVVTIAAGLWTHYSFPIVIAAINVAWLVWWIQRRGKARQREAAIWWLSLHVAAAILYLPWLPTAWGKVLGYGPISESRSVSFIVGQALKLLSVGETVPDDDLTRWLTVGMVGLSIFGAWGSFAPTQDLSVRDPVRRLPRVYTLLLISFVLAPVAMMVVLALAGRSAYRPKFFLVASPAFCLLVGEGISLLESASGEKRTWSSQLWLLLGLAVVGVGAARSLRHYYYDPAYARSDYRAIAAYVQSMEREGDAILLDAPNQWEVFTYYHQGRVPVYPVCRSRPPIEAEVVVELEEIAARRDRLFVLYWATEESDPERIVERWLEANAFKAADVWYGDVRLATYAVPEALDAVEMAYSVEDVRLGEAIALRGYALMPSEVHRGDILQVTLFWEALGVPAGRYKVFLHLDAGGQIVSQFDGEPGDGMNPTLDWRPEQGVFPDRYGVPVPMTSAPGEYRLLIGLYDVRGAPRLPISIGDEPAGDAFLLATIEIR